MSDVDWECLTDKEIQGAAIKALESIARSLKNIVECLEEQNGQPIKINENLDSLVSVTEKGLSEIYQTI